MRIFEISKSKTDRFFSAFEDSSTALKNDRNEGRRVGNAIFDLIPYGNDGVVLKMLSVPNRERNKGEGRTAVKFICDLADKYGITLYLHALSQRRTISERGLNTRSLVEFYGRYGFEAANKEAQDAFLADPLSGLHMFRRPS